MKISFPIDALNSEKIYKNNQEQRGGFYPIGSNSFWHSGIHLHGAPAIAMLDGEIIAYRIEKEFQQEKDEDGIFFEYSRNFILIRHKIDIYKNLHLSDLFSFRAYRYFRTIGKMAEIKENGITIYSLYMHLAPSNFYNDTESTTKYPLPNLYRDIYYTCNTQEDIFHDEKGLNIRSTKNYDSPDNIIGLIKYGEEITFKDPNDFKENPFGWKKIIHDTELQAFIFTSPKSDGTPRINTIEGIDTKTESTVVLTKPIKIKAGQILGYYGKYRTQKQVFHLELFTDNIDFMEIDPDPIEQFKYYLFKEAFEDYRKLNNPVIFEAYFSSDSKFSILKKEKGGYKVKVVKLYLWIKKSAFYKPDSILDVWPPVPGYQWNKKWGGLSYGLPGGFVSKKDIDNFTVCLTIKIKTTDIFPEPPKFRTITVKGEEYWQMLVEVEDDICGWISKSQAQKTKKMGSTLIVKETGISNLYKYNPENPPADKFSRSIAGPPKKELHIPVNSTLLKKISDSEGTQWIGFTFINIWNRTVSVWIKKHVAEKYKINYLDWWKFFEKHESEPDKTSLCSNTELINLIEKKAEVIISSDSISKDKYDSSTIKNDGLIMADELFLAMKDEELAKKLRNIVVSHPTEWSSKTINWELESMAALTFYDTDITDILKARHSKLAWWEDVKEKLGDSFPAPEKLWYFHPITFIDHLKKITTGFSELEIKTDYKIIDYWEGKILPDQKSKYANFIRDPLTIEEITLHHTAGENWPSLKKWLIEDIYGNYKEKEKQEKLSKGIGFFHYVLEKNGTIWEVLPPDRWFFHSSCGKQDKTSLGIEIVHNYGPFTDLQYQTLFSFLFNYSPSKYPGYKRISCHDYNNTDIPKGCPSIHFDFDRLENEIKSRGIKYSKCTKNVSAYNKGCYMYHYNVFKFELEF